MNKKLPKRWVDVQLIELLATLETGTRPKGGVQGILDGIPSIGGEHLNNDGGFKFDKIKYVPIKFAASMNRGKIKEKDILIVKDGATTGKTSFVNTNFPFDKAFVNEHVFLCRPSKLISAKCLYYFLRSGTGQGRVMSNFAGAAQGGINTKFSNNTLVSLPPFPEQQRIVDKLDTLFGHLDRIKISMERIPQLLKDFRQKVLTQAVSGKLTEDWREGKVLEPIIIPEYKFEIEIELTEEIEFPAIWYYTALGNYAECSRGKFTIRPRNDPQYFGGKFPFMQIGDLPRDGGVFFSYSSTLNEKGINVSKSFPKGTVVIAIVGATIGNTGILEKEIYFPDSLIGINSKTSYSNYFIEYFLRSIKFKIRELSYAGGGQPNIKLPFLRNLAIALPPLEEQQEIVRRVESLFARAGQIEASYQNLKTKVMQLPQALLAKAFRGELVEQLPTDGDARELLAQIKKARAALEKPKEIGKYAESEQERLAAEPKVRYRKKQIQL